MRSKFCIFFVYKNLCNILRLYSKSSDLCSHPCCVKNTSLIHIFGFAIGQHAFSSTRFDLSGLEYTTQLSADQILG